MPGKLRKTRSRKNRRRTFRRVRKGGSHAQIPSAAFSAKIGAPINSADPWYN